jgi:hypothetical protein
MSRASIPTLLSLDRFARMMNISPVHFAGAYGSTIWPVSNGCEDLWPQHAWQAAEIIASREIIAEVIHDAEWDIINALGYSPAPRFFVQEPHGYRLRYDGAWQMHRRVHTKFAKVLAGGIRGSTVIEANAEVTYSDEDGDGWDEIATVVVTTTVTDPREVKLYFVGESGDPVWEIRPLKTVVISGGTATITAHSWLFINPVLWEAYPTTDGFEGIDISTTANFVEEVDVYREFVDTSARSVQFWWAPGSCGELDTATQNGTLLMKDPETGYVTPVPADYTDGSWGEVCFNPVFPPTGMNFWYYAGLQDERYINQKSLDPLSEYWAQAIVWLAVSKIEMGVCNCGPPQYLLDEYRRDLALVNRNARNMVSMDMLDNPFGTRVGAVRAWDRVQKVAGENFGAESI